MKVIIIGGGIGGLSVAIALKQRGIDYEVYEAAAELKEIGAGIWVPPNAMNVFERLGIGGKIKSAGTLMEEIAVGNHRGEIYQTIRAGDVIRRYGNATTTIHRGRLQRLLFEELDPGKMHLGKQFTRLVDGGEKVEAFFKDGSSSAGDVLLGADGLRSAVRRQIFGEVPLRYAGQTCWRSATNFRLPGEIAHRMIEMWGPGQGLRFAYSQMSETQVYFYATLRTEAGGEDTKGAIKESLKKQYACFGPLVGEILDSAEEQAIIRTDLFDFKPVKCWVKGRVALLGDAAHATTPNLGQGGAQAIEDGYVLGLCLSENRPIEQALARYEAIRREIAVHVVNTSWSYGKMTNWENGLLIWLRSFLMRNMPASFGERQLEKVYRLNY
jgi:2-polyprenyl-6-methoxyphenol hydroxylase-like FAD-dependent oxidoreductase